MNITIQCNSVVSVLSLVKHREFMNLNTFVRIERRDETTESDAGTERLSEDQSFRKSVISGGAEQSREQNIRFQPKPTPSTSKLGLGEL